MTVEKAVPVLRWEKAALTLTETGTPAVLDAPEVELVNGEVFDGDILYSFTESASTAQRTVWQNGLPKDAGIWTVRASIAESSNYTAASADLTLTILPADSGETGGDNNDGDGGNEDSIGGNAGSDDSGGTVTPGGSGTTITPNTGDYAMPLLLLGILLLSGTALPLLLRRKRPE